MALQPWALTTVAAVEEAFNLTPGTLVPQIEAAINAASARLEALTARKLKSRLYTNEKYDGVELQPEFLTLRNYPVTDVDELLIYDDVNTLIETIIVTDLSQLKILDPGFLYLPQSVFSRGIRNIAVTYTGGYLEGVHDAELLDLEQACLDMIAIMGVPGEGVTRSNPGVRRESLGNYSISYFDLTGSGSSVGGGSWPISISYIITSYGKFV
jgi:hypothetical protein